MNHIWPIQYTVCNLGVIIYKDLLLYFYGILFTFFSSEWMNELNITKFETRVIVIPFIHTVYFLCVLNLPKPFI